MGLTNIKKVQEVIERLYISKAQYKEGINYVNVQHKKELEKKENECKKLRKELKEERDILK